jgi:hypothetical protein
MMFRVKFSYGIVLTPMLSGCFNPKDAVDRNPPTFSPKADISKFVQGGWIRIQETANATMPLPASIAFTSHERITASFNRDGSYTYDFMDYEAHNPGSLHTKKIWPREFVELTERGDHTAWMAGQHLLDLYIGRDGQSLECYDPSRGPAYEPWATPPIAG